MRVRGDVEDIGIEWPTLCLIVVCVLVWMGGVGAIGATGAWWALPLLALPVALHSSLQHEAIHGHPTRWPRVNMLLVLPAVGLFLPFHRFRDLHIIHHSDCDLGDPLSDPESPCIAGERWDRAGPALRMIWTANATVLGRLTIGPLVSVGSLVLEDIRRVGRGQWHVVGHWLLHGLAVLPVAVWLSSAGVPLWQYALLAAWPGMSILMLRTFAEHRLAPDLAGRSATVRRGGVFALLFLNNHLHAAHHHSPGLAWYRLPALARRLEREQALTGERFESYGSIIRRWFLRPRRPIVDLLGTKGT